MRVKLYKNKKATGWLGWLENTKKTTIAFIRLDGTILWDW